MQNQHTRELTRAQKDVTQTSFFEDVPLVEFMYLVFTRMPDESYCMRLGSLLFVLVGRLSSVALGY